MISSARQNKSWLTDLIFPLKWPQICVEYFSTCTTLKSSCSIGIDQLKLNLLIILFLQSFIEMKSLNEKMIYANFKVFKVVFQIQQHKAI